MRQRGQERPKLFFSEWLVIIQTDCLSDKMAEALKTISVFYRV